METKPRRKFNSTRNGIGKIDYFEESSSPEIVVNSTSIFSLSSEAAQLTIKNGSTIAAINGGQPNGNDTSKSSDEISITYCNLDPLNDLSGNENGQILTKKLHRNDDSIDQNSVESDDTSYAKAISQTIHPEVSPVVSGPGGDGQMHLCHTIHHSCCHHHLEHHHHHLHHHHHHPHHVQHEQCRATNSVPIGNMVEASTIVPRSTIEQQSTSIMAVHVKGKCLLSISQKTMKD